MTKLAIAATALALAVSGVARADSVLVLNSEDASYSILSRSGRVELVRLPIGREPHHLMPTPDGKELLVGSTATNELLVLDAKTGEKRRVVRDIIDPYQLGFSPDGKWFVTVAYRLDHVDIYRADGFKLAGRIFIDGLPSHMSFDTDSKTVFVTLQQTGRVVAFDLETQAIKWNVEVGKAPAGVIMLPDNKRLLVALTGEDGPRRRRSQGRVGRRASLQHRQGCAQFLAQGRWPALVPEQPRRGHGVADRHPGHEGRGHHQGAGRSRLTWTSRPTARNCGSRSASCAASPWSTSSR